MITFRDASQPPDTSGLADALSEQVIAALSAHAGLRVTARESAHAFRAGALEPQDVARQLAVAFVLDGSLQRDPLTLCNAAPWDNLRAVIEAILIDPLLENLTGAAS